MGKMFDEALLPTLKRRELQQLAKKHGVKANRKNSELIAELRQLASTTTAEVVSSGATNGGTPKTKRNCSKAVVPHSMAMPQCNSTKSDPAKVSLCYDAILEARTGDALTDQLMSEINTKAALSCQDALKQGEPCRIPRFKKLFAATGVSKSPHFSSIYKNSMKKVDSIDVYLEKKKKRAEMLKRSRIAAKDIASKTQVAITKMKQAHSTPVRSKTSNTAKPRASKPSVGFSFRSPCAEVNKSFKTAQTPAFDLQQSLKRRLSYKPHQGKLVAPVAVKRTSPTQAPMDVKITAVRSKNVTCMRGRRREEVSKTRAKARGNAVSSRRGIA